MAQRVSSARVRVGAEIVAEMGQGLLALVGVARSDGLPDARDLAARLVHLRIFPDAGGRMNRSLLDVAGTLGLVSQFTLLGDARQGRRPAFTDAAPSAEAEPLVEALAAEARALGAPVVGGRFGAHMEVSLVNDGPVTILLDTTKVF